MNLPKIKIEIHGIEYDNTFADDIRIDRTNLDEEFATQAEKYAYYAFLAEEAKSAYEFLKFEVEQLYATVDHEKRMAAEAVKAQNKSFKYTETMCANEVITDKRYVDKKGEMLNAKKLAGQLDQAAKSVAQRRDMLQQLGANTRNSMQPTRAVEQRAEAAHDIIAQNQASKAAPTLPETPAEETQPPPTRRTRRKPKAATA
jgi:hypothetical protein